MQDTTRPIELLEEICTIDSRTFEGAQGTTRVAEIMGTHLASMGFGQEWFDTEPSGKRGRHLKAVRNPDAAKRLLLLAHVDTILSPSDVPFRLDTASGRAYGSGVCDMKGGCVLLIEALRRALDVKAVQEAGLCVLLNCAEEFCEPSFRALARASATGALAALNFEPSPPAPDGRQQVVVSRKSVVRFELSCTGRAAHAGNCHESGVNAIREIARKVEQIEDITDYGCGLTANVGRITGGHVSNQVADHASILFELRAFDPAVLDAGFEALHRICSKPTVHAVNDGAATSMELRKHTAYPPWPRSPATDALAARYIDLAKAHGLEVIPSARGGGADVSHVADLVPALDGLGIVGGGMHTRDEWADIGTLAPRIQAAADLMTELCKEGR